ncbi:MAG TPA: hypothetical protein VLC92_01215 [Rhodocyclaceae bacterium]|nr:hypothetical protein [Rhodocyclaceae bacterium]
MMTSEQQAALAAVAGKALSAEQVAIVEPMLAARDDVAIAAALSVGRTRLVPCKIGVGSILAALNPGGGAFLEAVEAMGATDLNVKWAMYLIKSGELDVGMAVTREMLTAFAAEHPGLAASVAALMALAEVPEVVGYNLVSDALNIAEGRMTL